MSAYHGRAEPAPQAATGEAVAVDTEADREDDDNEEKDVNLEVEVEEGDEAQEVEEEGDADEAEAEASGDDVGTHSAPEKAAVASGRGCEWNNPVLSRAHSAMMDNSSITDSVFDLETGIEVTHMPDKQAVKRIVNLGNNKKRMQPKTVYLFCNPTQNNQLCAAAVETG
jgi:hypothetical protein